MSDRTHQEEREFDLLALHENDRLPRNELLSRSGSDDAGEGLCRACCPCHPRRQLQLLQALLYLPVRLRGILLAHPHLLKLLHLPCLGMVHHAIPLFR